MNARFYGPVFDNFNVLKIHPGNLGYDVLFLKVNLNAWHSSESRYVTVPRPVYNRSS